MWASTAKFQGCCKSKLHCIDWQQSRDEQGGWLASGSIDGTVGVSWIASRKVSDGQADNVACTQEACLYKSHFMLKGHIGEVKLVKWVPNGGDKLASYDSWGRIIIYYNRANVLAYHFQVITTVIVTDMQWSPCGFYIAICGREGRIQMISGVNGMTLFAVQMEATNHHTKPDFTCCAWNKPGTRFALGTASGEVLLLDPAQNGSAISTISLKSGSSVLSIQWYGDVITCHDQSGTSYESQRLSIYLNNGDVVLFKTTSHMECICSKTRTVDGLALWNSTYTSLAVVGYKKNATGARTPSVRFLNDKGYIIFTVSEGLKAASTPLGPVDSISWALDDSILLVAQGSSIFSIEVQENLSTLKHLCKRCLTDDVLAGCSEQALKSLPLPRREIEDLTSLTSQLIPDPFPSHDPNCIETLFQPLPSHQRLHCILDANDDGFVLKYEFLNHFIPLLQAVKKPKKGGIFRNGYFIEPAFDPVSKDLSPLSQASGGYCASKIQLPRSTNSLLSPRKSRRRHSFSRQHRATSFLQRLKLAITPGHGQVVDATQQETAGDLVEGATAVAAFDRPILAEVDGRSVVNHFRFHTASSSLFQDGALGSLNISTNYVKCKPRRINVKLANGSAADEGEAITLHSKSPDWNERYQIYELDFGGRVGRDSIKNFQIDSDGHVVLQFGRSSKSQYCLDFQAPFSPVQALCVALACIL